jgi:hypothetical protein
MLNLDRTGTYSLIEVCGKLSEMWTDERLQRHQQGVVEGLLKRLAIIWGNEHF